MSALTGKTVLLTRTESDCADWAERLRRIGARPIVFPCLSSEPLGGPATAERLRIALIRSQWFVLTSRRAVARTLELIEPRLPDSVQIAAVGPQTAAAARDAWGRIDLVASDGTGCSLARDLAARLNATPGREAAIVIAAAEGARRDLERELQPLGVQIHRIAVYRTLPAAPSTPREDLGSRGIDVIFLASPSAVEGLLARAEVPTTASIVTIGPATSAAARAAGLRIAGQATRRDLEGLVEVVS